MSSSTGKKIITILMLLNISRSKGNQTMKFGQLREYEVRNIFLKNYADHEAGRLVPDPFLFSKAALF